MSQFFKSAVCAMLFVAVVASRAGELPPYVAATPNVHGVVRIHDSELTQHLVHLWQDGFLKQHPLVRYKEYTVPAWFNGLCADTADLAFAGRRAYLTELKHITAIGGE